MSMPVATAVHPGGPVPGDREPGEPEREVAASSEAQCHVYAGKLRGLPS